MEKKLALLLLVPLLSFLVVPMATVSAHYPNVTLYTWCRDSDYYYSTSATITIHGVQVEAYCPPGYGETYYDGEGTCLYLSSPAKFTVTAVATGSLYKLTGTFSSHSGAIFGSRSGGVLPGPGDTYVLWALYPGCE